MLLWVSAWCAPFLFRPRRCRSSRRKREQGTAQEAQHLDGCWSLKAGESAGADRVIELYENVEARVVDLSTGDYTDVDPDTFDARRAALDPAQSEEIPLDKDQMKIKRRAKLSDVYVISEGNRVRKGDCSSEW